MGGVADCAARRLRTICPPADSFAADPARILRGVRLAARAGLEVDGPTAEAMEAQAAAIAALPQGRLQMEVGSLLGYGAAGASLALMWRLGLLDLLLPQHALFLSVRAGAGFRTARGGRAEKSSAACRPEPANGTSVDTATSHGVAHTSLALPCLPYPPCPQRHRVPRAPRSAVALRRQRGSLLFQLMAELDAHVHPQARTTVAGWGGGWSGVVSWRLGCGFG